MEGNPGMRRSWKIIVLMLVIALAGWGVYRHLAMGRALAQTQRLLAQTETAKQAAEQELTIAREQLKLAEAQRVELAQLQTRVQELETKVQSLSAEQELLVRERSRLVAQLEGLKLENGELERRLGSLTELKKAIKDVRHKMYLAKVEAWRVRIQAQRAADLQALAAGNRGYVVKDGELTLRATEYRVRVVPADAADSP